MAVVAADMADETDIEDSLSNRAYNLARAGMTMPLFSFLNNKDEQEIDSIINKVFGFYLFRIYSRANILTSNQTSAT